MWTMRTLLIVAALACASFSPAAFAASKAEKEKIWEKEWRHLEVERGKKSDEYGPRCQESLTSRGEGKVGLGITQVWAKLRTRKNWEEAATKLFGAEYAKWSRAKRASNTCEAKEGVLHCRATAFPCK